METINSFPENRYGNPQKSLTTFLLKDKINHPNKLTIKFECGYRSTIIIGKKRTITKGKYKVTPKLAMAKTIKLEYICVMFSKR